MRTKFSLRCSAVRSLLAPLAALTVLILIVGLSAQPAIAQAPASIFQLDGKATNSNLTCTYGPCDYWNLLNGTGGAGPIGTNSSAGSSAVRVFINGLSSTDSFTGGGSKDANLLSQWAYSTGSTPNKDTLNAGYAAAYNVSDFDVIFGADRASPNGDANIGIWFFQQSVGLNGSGGFTGAHANGDVFVISAFTGGGGTSTITVYAWDQPGLPNAINGGCASGVKSPKVGQCADTNLLLLASPTTVCGASPYCAITNSATTASTWEGNLASPLFFEGGVDITQAFAAVGGTVPCFASFLEETRSSQSTTAVLKDFLLGGFPVCSITITKACGTASVNSSGTSITYPVNGTVTNTGIGAVTNAQVKDCIGGSFSIVGGVETCSGTLDTVPVTNNTVGSPNNGTSTLGAKETGTWSDSSSSTAGMQSDQAFAVASAGGTALQSTNTASQTCSLSVNTTLTITKSCSTSLVTATNGTTVDVVVSYGGQVCNTGSSQVTGVAITDYPDSVANTSASTGSVVDSSITLGPAGTATACATYGPHNYTPTAIDETINGGTGAGRYFFDDLVTITSATATLGTLTKTSGNPDPRENGVYGFGTARCPICQGSAECTTP